MSIAVPARKHPCTLDQWLAHCERLHASSMELGLDRVRAAWRRMDLQLTCPVIMVAGTNGKGSTCAMLESIYRAAGYRTAVYTSPHLLRFEERCRLDSVSVPGERLTPHFARVEAARHDGAPITLTQFEFTTLAILSLIAQAAPEVAILEVGLGGRLDAVNIVDPDCALITGIDLDHMAFLGPDRESIGLEKAGILRAGHPAVLSDPHPPASVLRHAAAIGADLRCLGRDFGHVVGPVSWEWNGRKSRYIELPSPALRGAHQWTNASGVLAAVEALMDTLPVPPQAIATGLERVRLRGRFQVVPGQPTWVLDVAHNPHAVASLADNLRSRRALARTHAVFGAMADKDLPQMLACIAHRVDAWYFTDLPSERAATGGALRQCYESLDASRPDVTAQEFMTPELALAAASDAARPDDQIIVFGSFLTVAAGLRYLGETGDAPT